MYNNDFYDWIDSELTERGWGVTELSRRMGITHSAVSHVLSKRNKPSTDFCSGLAKAFGVSPTEVFRKAGLLPKVEGVTDPQLQSAHDLINSMTPEQRQQALNYMRFLIQNQESPLPATKQKLAYEKS